MEYTIHKLAKLAGITTRTLRYYDQIGLLKPVRVNDNGYRIYGEQEVQLLQHILFYREFEVGLEDIKKIIYSPNFNDTEVLQNHYQKLLKKREKINQLIKNVEKTIKNREEGTEMSDEEKFDGFKEKLIEENESNYGKEIRQKYGEEKVKKSYEQLKNMNQKEYEEITKLEEEIHRKLEIAFQEGNPASELAQKVAELHKKWLTFYWGQYSKEAHVGIANMYVEDPRFTAYYDSKNPGTAKFLRDAILIYTKN